MLAPHLSTADAQVTNPPIPRVEESWATESMDLLMRQHDISCAGLVIVQDGQVVVERAYGTVARDIRTTPDVQTSLFRVASVGKVFTALAALQCVDKGIISLQDDLRATLSDVLRGSVDAELTLYQLLTHTAGFDERIIGYASLPEDESMPLSEYLSKRMPPRTSRPEMFASYSNHGYALIGLLVERLTGTSYDKYAHDNIFTPLGMHETRYLLGPLSILTRESLVHEYWSNGDRAVYSLSRPYPAGSMATSVHDMGLFLTALTRSLGGEPVEGIPLTASRALTTAAFSGHPDIQGTTLGMGSTVIGDTRVYLKSGAAPAHTAMVAILPDYGLSFFLAGNRHELRFVEDFLRIFCERYAPSRGERMFDDSPRTLPQQIEGSYLLTRTSRDSVEKLLSLAATIHITSRGDTFEIESSLENFNNDWVQASPTSFSSSNGRQIGFLVDESGSVDHVVMTIGGDQFTFERIGPLQDAKLLLPLVGLAIVIPLLLSALQGIAWCIRRVRARASVIARRDNVRLSTLLASTEIVNLIVSVAIVVTLVNWKALIYGPTTSLVAAELLGIVSVTLAAVCLIQYSIALVRGRLSMAHATTQAIQCAAVIGFAIFLVEYNVLGAQW
jgi:CubicO group peptidase (beta-lactamase class C family)